MRELLADFVRRVRNEKGLSTSEVEKKSRGLISDSYVSRIENGYVKDVSPSKLSALATGLGIPENDLFRVARGLPDETDERYTIYAERFDAHDLSETEWQYLELFFKDQIDRFRHDKSERRRIIEEQYPVKPKPKLAEVVAKIEPGKKTEVTREDVQRMINSDEAAEAQRRTTPRKKKAG